PTADLQGPAALLQSSPPTWPADRQLHSGLTLAQIRSTATSAIAETVERSHECQPDPLLALGARAGGAGRAPERWAVRGLSAGGGWIRTIGTRAACKVHGPNGGWRRGRLTAWGFGRSSKPLRAPVQRTPCASCRPNGGASQRTCRFRNS